MIGRIWKLGDDINTDILAPGGYIKLPIEQLAAHCLETVNPNFSKSIKKGDIVVAGKNFGVGSSREQAAQVLKILGVASVIATSFGGIFYRNAFNLGLPVVSCKNVDDLKSNDEISLDLRLGKIKNMTRGIELTTEPVPDNLMKLIEAGGLVPSLEAKLGIFKGEN